MKTEAIESCTRAAETEAALDGRLDPAAEAEALTHARGCAECGALERSLRLLRETARSLPAPTLDADAVLRVRAEVIASAERGGQRKMSPVLRALAVAAVVTAVLGGGALLRRRTPTAAIDGIDLAGVGTLRPERAAVFHVERAGADTRIVLSEGTIHLAVMHRQRAERFVVALGDAEVEARGTRFAVDAHEGHLRRVRVTEGLVAVRRSGQRERFVAAGGTLEVADPVALTPPAATLTAITPDAMVAGVEAVAPGPHVDLARPAAAAIVGGMASQEFRAGALAYVRGETTEAALALQRFLAVASARDPRREDARYVLVLALDASNGSGVERAAREYLAEFPRGLRLAEVTVRLTRRLSARGACDSAAHVALGMPETADTALRTQVAEALSRCAGTADD